LLSQIAKAVQVEDDATTVLIMMMAGFNALKYHHILLLLDGRVVLTEPKPNDANGTDAES